MASTRSTNTQSEALKGMLSQIAEVKTYPDADIEWLLGLETQILTKLRQPVQEALQSAGAMSDVAGQMAPSMDPSMGGAPSPPPMPMAGTPGPTASGPGVPGLRQGPGMPNPDELRRLLTQGQ